MDMPFFVTALFVSSLGAAAFFATELVADASFAASLFAATLLAAAFFAGSKTRDSDGYSGWYVV